MTQLPLLLTVQALSRSVKILKTSQTQTIKNFKNKTLVS